jgi:thioesterase domain-containing protein
MGVIFPYLDLARRLGPEQPFYGLQPPGIDGEQPPATSIEEMAAHYVEAIRAVQPDGPYYLGGWSFGALVADEMARQLDAIGQEVALLAAIDSPAPGVKPSLGGSVRALIEMLGRGFWPYLREYASLRRSVREREDGSRPAERRGGLANLRALASSQSFLEAALVAAVARARSRPDSGSAPALGPMFEVLAASNRAVVTYLPRTFAGRVTVFRTREHRREAGGDGTWGWGKLARGGVAVRWVPGTHMTLLREPYVATLADRLSQALDQASRRAPVARSHRSDARSDAPTP